MMPLIPQSDFNEITQLIHAARQRAVLAVNTALIELYWQVGQFISRKIEQAEWGDGVVAQLAEHLARTQPGLRGLTRCTPCNFTMRDEVVRALAETHVELVLIHPFRDGNGRVARVLSTLMALQAGLPLLDFSAIADEEKEGYFAAVQAGLDRNYRPMEKIFAGVIERSVAES